MRNTQYNGPKLPLRSLTSSWFAEFSVPCLTNLEHRFFWELFTNMVMRYRRLWLCTVVIRSRLKNLTILRLLIPKTVSIWRRVDVFKVNFVEIMNSNNRMMLGYMLSLHVELSSPPVHKNGVYIARISKLRINCKSLESLSSRSHYQLSRYKFGTERCFPCRGMRKKVKLFRQFYRRSKIWLRQQLWYVEIQITLSGSISIYIGANVIIG